MLRAMVARGAAGVRAGMGTTFTSPVASLTGANRFAFGGSLSRKAASWMVREEASAASKPVAAAESPLVAKDAFTLLPPVIGTARSILTAFVGSWQTLAAGAACLTAGYFFFQDYIAESLLAMGVCEALMPAPSADEEGVYVERANEALLTAYVESKYKKYLAVYGPHGAGKSTLVQHTLSARDGVVYVQIAEKLETRPLPQLVLAQVRKVGVPKLFGGFGVFLTPLVNSYIERATLPELAGVFKAAAHRRRAAGGADDQQWQPTVVVDLTSTIPDGDVENLGKNLKELTHDLVSCRGILLLSSSFAVANLVTDPGRQSFLSVGYASADEAADLLKKRLQWEGVKGDTAIAAVAERVLALTTNPALLVEAATTVAAHKDSSEEEMLRAADAWAEAWMAAAVDDVEGTLNMGDDAAKDRRGRRGFHVHRLMAELVRTGTPVKIRKTTYLEEPEKFATTLRDSQAARRALTIDLVAGTVDFASHAHRLAAADVLRVRSW